MSLPVYMSLFFYKCLFFNVYDCIVNYILSVADYWQIFFDEINKNCFLCHTFSLVVFLALNVVFSCWTYFPSRTHSTSLNFWKFKTLHLHNFILFKELTSFYILIWPSVNNSKRASSFALCKTSRNSSQILTIRQKKTGSDLLASLALAM